MLQQINKKIIFYISLVIILGTLNNKNLKNFDLPKISIVNIEGIEFDNNEFLEITSLIKFNNLFSIQKSQIKKIFNSNNLIEEYEVFKRYPSTIEIKIKKTNFLASTRINGKNYLVGSNGKLIDKKEFSEDLPFVFGNFETEKFLELKSIILQTDFKYNNIENFYYFPSGRWDIKMISGITIKLPISGIKESLNLSIDLLNNKEFSKIKILDIRQKNQIVIND